MSRNKIWTRIFYRDSVKIFQIKKLSRRLYFGNTFQNKLHITFNNILLLKYLVIEFDYFCKNQVSIMFEI